MGVIPDDFTLKNPGSGEYMRFEKGVNKFRVLGPGVGGYVYWTTSEDGKRKPNRKRFSEKILVGDLEDDSKPKTFLALPVWNYQAQDIQVLEITQKGILKALHSYENNPDWGPLTGYDISVTREGDGFDTEYTVLASPAKPLPQAISDKWETAVLDLEALYSGNDPFAAEF